MYSFKGRTNETDKKNMGMVGWQETDDRMRVLVRMDTCRNPDLADDSTA
jgi:hypothetical protein